MISAILFYSIFVLQPFEGWTTLSKLEIEGQYDEFFNETIDVPVFSDDLLVFDGKQIEIEGYVIPLQSSGEQEYFVLSRFPYNSCFFCGNAGPETVAEVYVTEPVTVQDERVLVKGRLKLNDQDPLHLFYIIEEASVKRLD